MNRCGNFSSVLPTIYIKGKVVQENRNLILKVASEHEFKFFQENV